MPNQSLRGGRGDGVIAVLLTPADVRAAKQLDMPGVTFAGARTGAPAFTTSVGKR